MNELRRRGIGRAATDLDASVIVGSWIFPVHSTAVNEIDTRKSIADEQIRIQRVFMWDEAGYGEMAAEFWDLRQSDAVADYLDPDDSGLKALEQAKRTWIAD